MSSSDLPKLWTTSSNILKFLLSKSFFCVKNYPNSSSFFFSLVKYQFRSQTFFDNFIFLNNLYLKWCHQKVIFVGLITSTENVQKNLNVIFVISGVIASFWRVFIKFRWHGQTLTLGEVGVSLPWWSPLQFL